VRVQLRHLVAERRDVELLAFGDRFECARGVRDLIHQFEPVMVGQIDDLDEAARRGTRISQG
jgi:hypothetical protein